MTHQSHHPICICLLLISGCFANNAVIIRTLDFCSYNQVCYYLFWTWSGSGLQPPKPTLNSAVKSTIYSQYIHHGRFSYWDYLPLPNGNVYICVQNTNFCLGADYDLSKKRFEIVIWMKDDKQYGLLQQWRYDDKKLSNARLGPNYCATFVNDWAGTVTMKPCDPANPYQKIEMVAA